MATLTLNYNARNALALSILEVIKNTKAFKIITPQLKGKSPLQISLQQAKNGNVNSYSSVNDFFEKISKNV
ncbi:MAG: hypothetical protein LBN23_07590 [Paludibacter sp.]|jgi:hypothetical protein|nr:hypothetical protein [Paludibacter sp.]